MIKSNKRIFKTWQSWSVVTKTSQKLSTGLWQLISESKPIRISFSSLAAPPTPTAKISSLKLVANSSLETGSFSLMKMSLYLLWLSLRILKNIKTLDRGVIHVAQLGKRSATSLTHIVTSVVFQIAKSAWRKRENSAQSPVTLEVQQWVRGRREVRQLKERFANYVIANSILKQWYKTLHSWLKCKIWLSKMLWDKLVNGKMILSIQTTRTERISTLRSKRAAH